MSVEIAWEVAERPLDDAQVRAAADAGLAHGGRSGMLLSIVFVDDATLARMHGDWLDDPSETDVLSFDLTPAEGDVPAEEGSPDGELYVSVDRARKVAAENGMDPVHELLLYVVHGCLHLCGYDDHEPDERRRMRNAEAACFEALGLPPARWTREDDACG